MVVPNITEEGGTTAIVLPYDIAKELHTALGAELYGWEVVSYMPDSHVARDMAAHIDPDNLNLNMGEQ